MNCLYPGCQKPAAVRGLCNSCYSRERDHGALAAYPLMRPKGRRPKAPAPCLVAGCTRPGSYANGLCGSHYYRRKAWGDVRADIPIRVARFSPESFWEGVSPEPNTGCWLWIGRLNADGYGVASRNGKTGAHRMAWELSHGEAPGRMHVLHHCDTRSCVNPAHLFLGTQQDNMRDMYAKGRHWAQQRRVA